jgi:hypothetical protein
MGCVAPGKIRRKKDGQCLRLTTLPPSCAVVMKSGNLKFLECCNGTALNLSNTTTWEPPEMFI